jgi:hypothetical protein
MGGEVVKKRKLKLRAHREYEVGVMGSKPLIYFNVGNTEETPVAPA